MNNFPRKSYLKDHCIIFKNRVLKKTPGSWLPESVEVKSSLGAQGGPIFKRTHHLSAGLFKNSSRECNRQRGEGSHLKRPLSPQLESARSTGWRDLHLNNVRDHICEITTNTWTTFDFLDFFDADFKGFMKTPKLNRNRVWNRVFLTNIWRKHWR